MNDHPESQNQEERLDESAAPAEGAGDEQSALRDALQTRQWFLRSKRKD